MYHASLLFTAIAIKVGLLEDFAEEERRRIEQENNTNFLKRQEGVCMDELKMKRNFN